MTATLLILEHKREYKRRSSEKMAILAFFHSIVYYMLRRHENPTEGGQFQVGSELAQKHDRFDDE